MTMIKVPEGMLKAAESAAHKCAVEGGCGVYPVNACVEAVLRWLSEYPIVPTEDQCKDLLDEAYGHIGGSRDQLKFEIAQFQRKFMFHAPEPEIPEEIPEEIQDLLWVGGEASGSGDEEWDRAEDRKEVNKAILEAYRRGLAPYHGPKHFPPQHAHQQPDDKV